MKTLTCTNCGVDAPATQQDGNYIDNGISISLNDIGHYGGFTDNFSWFDKDLRLAHLCHDCCVILFDSLPGLAEAAQVKGGHYNTTSINSHSFVKDGTLINPCCAYAWTTDKVKNYTYISTPELTWQFLQDDNEFYLPQKEEDESI